MNKLEKKPPHKSEKVAFIIYKTQLNFGVNLEEAALRFETEAYTM